MPTLDAVYRSVVAKKIQSLETESRLSKNLPQKVSVLSAQLEILREIKREACTTARLQEIITPQQLQADL